MAVTAQARRRSRRAVPSASLHSARRLDGVNDYVEVVDAPSVRSPSTAVTVAGWARWPEASSGDAWNALAFKQWGTASPWMSYAIQQNGGTNFGYRMRIGDGVASHNTANLTALTPGTWYWLVGTWRSGQVVTLRAWDATGLLVQTVTSAAAVTTTIAYSEQPLFFGKNEVLGTARVDLAGWLVHNAVIPDADLASFSAGSLPYPPAVGYWPLAAELDLTTGVPLSEVDLAQTNHGNPQVTASIQARGPRATSDTLAPTPAGVATSDVGGTQFRLGWRTPEYATSAVEYGPTVAFGQTVAGSVSPDSLVHSILVAGLTPGGLYYCRARSADAAGNVGLSDVRMVQLATSDASAPTLSDLTADATSTSATITWTTDEPATSAVDYGLTNSYGGTVASPSYSLTHSITVVGLTAGSVYHYRVRSTDLAGNQATSAGFTLSTSAAVTGNRFVALTDTGCRIPDASLVPSSKVTTSAHGQVIEGLSLSGGSVIDVRHDNVIIRDCKIDWHPTASGQYAIKSAVNPDTGLRPANTLMHHITIDGRVDATMIDAVVAVYVELWRGVHAHHLRITDVGRGFRFRDDCILEDSYIVADYHQAGSTAHRTAAACDGGQRNIIRRNQLICKGQQSSSALSIYNDSKETFDFVIQDNYLAGADGYLSYGGCVTSKAFPVASDVRYIDNIFNFETPYTGPLYGGITAHDSGVRGNVRSGNTWKDAWTSNSGVFHAAGSPL